MESRHPKVLCTLIATCSKDLEETERDKGYRYWWIFLIDYPNSDIIIIIIVIFTLFRYIYWIYKLRSLHIYIMHHALACYCIVKELFSPVLFCPIPFHPIE